MLREVLFKHIKFQIIHKNIFKIVFSNTCFQGRATIYREW